MAEQATWELVAVGLCGRAVVAQARCPELGLYIVTTGFLLSSIYPITQLIYASELITHVFHYNPINLT